MSSKKEVTKRRNMKNYIKSEFGKNLNNQQIVKVYKLITGEESEPEPLLKRIKNEIDGKMATEILIDTILEKISDQYRIKIKVDPAFEQARTDWNITLEKK